MQKAKCKKKKKNLVSSELHYAFKEVLFLFHLFILEGGFKESFLEQKFFINNAIKFEIFILKITDISHNILNIIIEYMKLSKVT